MHPVICCKLSSVRSKRFCCVCGIISIVIPAYSLHVCTKISIISVDIYTKKFTIASICGLYCRLNICSCFQSLAFDTRCCSIGFSCCKCKTVAVLLSIFQTIGISSYISYKTNIGLKIHLAVSTGNCLTSVYNIILLAEICIICSFNCYWNIFQTIYFIMIHLIFFAVFCEKSSVPCSLRTICKNDSLIIFPVGNSKFCSVCCNNSCLCLITSSVKSVISSCSCYCIKSTFISLTFKVKLITGACVSCIINVFSSPVLTPCKSCIHILILTFQLALIRESFLCIIAC